FPLTYAPRLLRDLCCPGPHRDLHSFPHDALPIYELAAHSVPRSLRRDEDDIDAVGRVDVAEADVEPVCEGEGFARGQVRCDRLRSEEHTSELQSRENLVCRLLLEKKKQ